ncbi:MAG: hypothetical protein JST30_08395 [Armatimonadetes bacterium]|nr:hypothetical protein [Armatimonadota bacterium]
MPLSFDEAVARVSSLQNKGWRLELDRMRELVRRLDIGHWPRFVHIAGTNGKGSVTAFVQSLLIEQGWRTGAYFSPYVFSVRERIQFTDPTDPDRNRLIPPGHFAGLVEEVWPIAESLEPTEFEGPTEFEFKTAMGFLYWSRMKADYVALEVGLGGRLDATNVIESPASCAIVSIGLDHTHILGESHARIAIEKAGVIKEGRPVVVGDVPEEAFLAIETIAKINQAPLWRVGRDFGVSTGFDGFRVQTPGGSFERLIPGIQGSVQPHNMAVAIAAVEAAGAMREPRKVPHGCSRATAPGRMQSAVWNGQRFLLDGAHNAESSQALCESLASLPEEPGRIVLLTGMLEGHKPAGFYEPLSRIVDEVRFVPIDFHRTRSPEDLQSEAGWLFPRSFSHADVSEGLQAAMASRPDLIVVTGSFYLVGEVGRAIGLG